MKISEAFPSKYLKAADLQGRTVNVTIKAVMMEDFDNDEPKPIIFFEGKQKGMILNKTNANTLATAFGDDTNEWRGAEVELFSIMTEYQGKPTEGLRVRLPVRRRSADAITSGPDQLRAAVQQHRAPASAPDFSDDVPFGAEMRG